jgi:hypothetical protein
LAFSSDIVVVAVMAIERSHGGKRLRGRKIEKPDRHVRREIEALERGECWVVVAQDCETTWEEERGH